MTQMSCLKTISVLLTSLILAFGCASSSAKLGQVGLGMTREEVVKTLGKPHALTAQGNVEFLTYNLLNKGVGDMREYVIRMQAGVVESFGERASFGSTLLSVTNALSR